MLDLLPSYLFSLVGVTLILVVTGWAVSRYQRGLGKPGGRDGMGGIGDALGPLVELFHPAGYRATQEIKDQKRRASPSPAKDDDPDDDGLFTLLNGRDGMPRTVVLRRRTLRHGPGATNPDS